MRTYTLLLLLAFFSTAVLAQSPSFSRAAKGGGTGKDVGHGIAVANDGSVYVTSEFSGTGTFGGVTLVSAGNVDYALVKYDSAGNAVWGRKGGGTLTDRGYAVTVDAAGNVYTTGEYFGTSVFGSDTLISGGNLDGMVLKYDSDGNQIWLKDIKGQTGNYQDAARGIAVDSEGNVVVCGYFGGSTTPPTSVTFDTITITSYGLRDVFLVKYNNLGQVQWAKHYGGTGTTEEGKSVTIDAAGNIYLTGTINGTANFDAIVVTGNLGTDMFVTKISPAGNVLWVKTAGGPKADEGSGIAVDLLGNIYVSGTLDSAFVISGNTIVGKGGFDAFVAKYNSAGDFQWVKTAGGTANDYCNEVITDRFNNVSILGNFIGTANFLGDTLVSAGLDDIYMAQFDGDGNPLWLKHLTGNDADKGFGLDVDYGRNIYVTGSYKGTSFILDGFTFGTSGLEDIFYGRVGNNPVPVELTSFSASVNGRTVDLLWETATEVNNAGFDIQRSNDKENFSTIGFVKGKGTTTEKTIYNFRDTETKSAAHYYRLKQKDLDGSYVYSNTVEVNIGTPASFSLTQNFPNPFNPATRFSFSLPVDASVTIAVYNSIGEKILESAALYTAGTYTEYINGSSMSSGIYFYSVNAAGKDGSVYQLTKKMVLIK